MKTIAFTLFVFCSIVFSQKINLNYADIYDLSALNISKEKIEHIVKYREKHGDFISIYELLQIPNISIEGQTSKATENDKFGNG